MLVLYNRAKVLLYKERYTNTSFSHFFFWLKNTIPGMTRIASLLDKRRELSNKAGKAIIVQ